MNTEQTAKAKALFTRAQDVMWDIKKMVEEIQNSDKSGDEVNGFLDELLSAQRAASDCRLHLQASYLEN